MSVSPAQRFTQARPCPICGGSKNHAPGTGRRCWGFRSDDGAYAHCTRGDHAGGLPEGEDASYAHRVGAPCRCGMTHGTPTASRKSSGKVTHEIRDASGVLVAVHCRIYKSDGKRMWWERPDGTTNLGGQAITSLPLYGIHELPADAPYVIVTEGEPARDTLHAAGIPAVATVTGAKVIPRNDVLKVMMPFPTVALWPDNDSDGADHMANIKAALVALGHRDVRLIVWPEAPAKGDADDFFKMGGTAEECRRLVDARREKGPWEFDNITDVLARPDREIPWLEKPLLARGIVTQWSSPRGLGKSLAAQYLAVKLARQGKRVLYLDRDNPPRETKRRFRAFGADGLTTLTVATRTEIPPLTHAAEWAKFPVAGYDFIVIDSMNSTTEGIGEHDSAKPTRAIAPVLDIARSQDGPGFLLLQNTVKSGLYARGVGSIEDMIDITFEVRDATDLKPTGTKDWWHELPSTDPSLWGARASRRKRRAIIRLAFVQSKFRIGEEPEPLCLEVNMTETQWTIRDVTKEIIEGGEAEHIKVEIERVKKDADATAALAAEVERRATTGKPMLKTAAEEFLRAQMSRNAARRFIDAKAGTAWTLQAIEGQGNPVALLPIAPPDPLSGAETAEA
jgi:AAA domain